MIDKEKYIILSKEVDERLGEIVQEFSDVIGVIKNDQRFVRTRLLIAFSFLEILCNLYNAYYNLGLGNRALIKQWLNHYCLVESNSTYKAHPYMKMLTESHIYKFRNSIIHAFGLPESENGVSITSPNGLETSDVIKKMDEGFKRLGHKVAFISADALMQLFINGFTLMHSEIFKNVDIASQADFDGLERIVNEFGRRGAREVSLRG